MRICQSDCSLNTPVANTTSCHDFDSVCSLAVMGCEVRRQDSGDCGGVYGVDDNWFYSGFVFRRAGDEQRDLSKRGAS